MTQQLRQNIRNFLLTASLEQLEKELILSISRNDAQRAKYVQELIYEHKKESSCQKKDAI